MPGARLELALPYGKRILSPQRLPIPPPGHPIEVMSWARFGIESAPQRPVLEYKNGSTCSGYPLSLPHPLRAISPIRLHYIIWLLRAPCECEYIRQYAMRSGRRLANLMHTIFPALPIAGEALASVGIRGVSAETHVHSRRSAGPLAHAIFVIGNEDTFIDQLAGISISFGIM